MTTSPTPSQDGFQGVLQILKEQFFAELGLQGLSLEEKEQRFEEISEIIMGRVFLEIEDNLTPELKEKWVACKADEDIEKFIEENDIPIVDMVTAEASAYREEMIANMAYIQAKLDPKDVPPRS